MLLKNRTKVRTVPISEQYVTFFIFSVLIVRPTLN